LPSQHRTIKNFFFAKNAVFERSYSGAQEIVFMTDTNLDGGLTMIKCGTNITRIFCFGRTYLEHIRELSNAVPTTPVIFMKPPSCVVEPGELIHYPSHGNELHQETEIVVRIGREGKVKTEEEALSLIDSVSIGLDLTLRDVQDMLKKKGHPWELAKSFDQSSPLGTFVPYDETVDLKNISFGCKINGVQKQKGNTSEMMFSPAQLLVELCRVWTLLPGDLVYTGTPAGVGPVKIGDIIEIESQLTGPFSWSIVE
jgi:2-keto-4-pentenoate hydratase/2-oxohepta-3-ene-1,7-dioic acid hydratase in catechol pathway